MKIGMPGPDQSFDFRDLAAAPRNSCRDSHPRVLDSLECLAAGAERRLLARQVLPALDDDIDILWIEFDSVADALGLFGGDQCRATPEKRIVHRLAAFRVIQNRLAYQFDGLLRGVVTFLLLRSTHDEFR